MKASEEKMYSVYTI